MGFEYRNSRAKREGYIVLQAEFMLHHGDRQVIEGIMRDLTAKRKEKQPLEYPSAGSTFKRPQGYYAGKLISDSGLKGFTIGGAQVSEKHAGFLINTGNATCDDVLSLVDHIRKTVKEKTGYSLEREIIDIGK